MWSPMSDGSMAIGAFSRASLLSIKTLRAYHEAGILVPARVDPRTGYRVYHASQLPDAVVVRRLRAMDVPLDQVHEIVTARDPEVTRRVLAKHAETMQARLDEVTRIVAELQDTVDSPAAHTPVHLRHVAATHTLSYRGQVTPQNFATFLDTAYASLRARADRLGLARSGPPGALYPPEIAEDDVEDVEAYLPIDRPVPVSGGDGVSLGELPAARVAVAVHAGPYETIDDTYRQLGAWVALRATSANQPVREVYVVSYEQTDDTSRFRTEIHWPVTDEETTP